MPINYFYGIYILKSIVNKDKLQPPGTKTPFYFPELDAIRGLAFLMIFTLHASGLEGKLEHSYPFFNFLIHHLFYGVEIFFVLSAFLLTWLALNEKSLKNHFSLRHYFMRRILRIWPLYFLVLFVGFVIFPLLASAFSMKMTVPGFWYYATFIANFYILPQPFFLVFLWTISVEEQFYFFLGISMKFFMKYLPWIIGALYCISITFSVYSIFHGNKYYFNTLTYLFDFASGSLAAYLLFYQKGLVIFFRDLKKWQVAVFYSYLPFHFLIFYFLMSSSQGSLQDLFGLISRYFFILYSALFMIEQLVNSNRSRIFGRSRFLIFTGRISYGLYVFHGITITFIIVIFSRQFPLVPYWVLFLMTVVVNYAISWLSYKYYELPFLRLKSKWRKI